MSIDLFEAITTQRAIRRFTMQPVADEDIQKILKAATCAPSGDNRQPWEFIIIRDPVIKAKLRDVYVKALHYYRTEINPLPPATTPEELAARQQAVRRSFADPENLDKIPVLIVVCLTPAVVKSPITSARYASIYPAVQNLLLAARGLGLGTVLTTIHKYYEDEVKEILGIPDEVETVALIPLGYPATPFGPTNRKSVEEVTFYERWGRRRANT